MGFYCEYKKRNSEKVVAYGKKKTDRTLLKCNDPPFSMGCLLLFILFK